jgi:hypothetical protein
LEVPQAVKIIPLEISELVALIHATRELPTGSTMRCQVASTLFSCA